MSDDMNDRGSPDNKLIALEQDHEVRYWTAKFNVSEEELRAAVEKAGNSAAAVEKALARR